MSNQLDYLAKHIRDLILEIDTLEYVLNDISDAYVSEDEELDDSDHPVAKLQQSQYAISKATVAIVKLLTSEKMLDPYFRKSLQMMAMMDALKDGETNFVKFVNKYIKD
ncbi:hypothetical protein [Limnohabitans sp. B9-3]|uniref:hypothetical protein n=1 Tax=Limnohabitans sp. B9-3 TaxID=1100707 RepID=UPI000C1E488A|nr:hypothetical protein [Limnohabitans sp. B9-3]PIT76285.1 hypothetical protein B9Z42_06190 [Limnohabitans sp. B9-3]